MTVLIEDPLIAGMAIRQTLPLHESSRRLRELYPECPRVYGVAVMGDLSRRRWWPLAEAVDDRSLAGDVRDRRRGDRQPGGGGPAVGRHAGPRRRRPRRAAGRARGSRLGHRPGEPLGACGFRGCDRLGRRRRSAAAGAARRSSALADDGIVALPSEAALTTWVAHRSHRALEPLFARLFDVCAGAMSVASMWHIVGGAVVSAATQVPLLAGSSELTSMRRAQAVLDALVGFGLPVRGTESDDSTEGLAKLGQPCLF